MEPWHTEGYLKIASAWIYVATTNTFLNSQDRTDTFAILRDAGKQIREEHSND